MDIVESKDKNGHTLSINRSLDRTNVNDLKAAFGSLWESSKDRASIWVDISGLQAVDSAGLTCLLHFHRQALREGRRFALVHTNSYHRKILEITRLDAELVVFDEPGGVRVTRVARYDIGARLPEETDRPALMTLDMESLEDLDIE